MSAVELVIRLYDAFAKGDIPSVLGMMDPEVHWHEAEGNPYMPGGKAFVEPDSVLNNLFAKLANDWDGFAVHPKTYYDAGDVVVVEVHYGGTHKGTGKPLDVQVCHLWTVKSGKVSRFQQDMDTARFQDAMGVRVDA